MPSLTIHGRQVERASSALPLPMEHRSWASVAELAWLEAQIAAVELADTERRIVALERRLIDAAAWFSTREPNHPHWDAAERRRAGIAHEQRGCEAILPLIARRCWVGCCDLWVALFMGDMTLQQRIAWREAQNGPQGSLRRPQDIWATVAGDRSAPGVWPPDDRLWWVETRPRRVELWHIPEMRELLKAKGLAA